MLLAEAIEKYGDIVDGVWANESACCVVYTVPTGLSGWINSATGEPVTHIYCNRDLVQSLNQALQNVIQRNLISQLKTYDGCLNIRDVRGKTCISTHAYGLGIDINAKTNPLGETGSMNSDLVKCFIDAGFVWGGNFKTRLDPMHFSSAEFGWE